MSHDWKRPATTVCLAVIVPFTALLAIEWRGKLQPHSISASTVQGQDGRHLGHASHNLWTSTSPRMQTPIETAMNAPVRSPTLLPDQGQAALDKALSDAMCVSRRIRHYQNPDDTADTSPVPKVNADGKEYIPIYDDSIGSEVYIGAQKLQLLGVRSEVARYSPVNRQLRLTGVVKPDERSLRVLALRTSGFIETLFVNETGRHVNAGDPLFRVYSPEIVRAFVNDRISKLDKSDKGDDWQRLANLGLPEGLIRTFQANRDVPLTFDWPAPMTGVVLEKRVITGQMVQAGDVLYRFADPSTIWVLADVSEQALADVRLNAKARVSFRSYPGEAITGTVTFIPPEIDPTTRTAKVRIEVPNPGNRIKFEMFAEIDLDAPVDDAKYVSVPLSAVIDSGPRQIVFVDKGDGHYQPRLVTLGRRNALAVEVRNGISEGERVVVSSNFLLDSESNLKAALDGYDPSQRSFKP